MRLWLKEDVTVEELQNDFVHLEVYVCPVSNRNYIKTDIDFLDPATEDPHPLLVDMIEKITVEKYRIDRGFRTDGVYDYKAAVLVVQTHEELYVFPPENPTQMERLIWQEISICASSVEVLRTIFSQFRSGFLRPRENWEANAKSALPAKHVEIKDFELDPPTKPNNGQFDWDKYHGKS